MTELTFSHVQLFLRIGLMFMWDNSSISLSDHHFYIFFLQCTASYGSPQMVLPIVSHILPFSALGGLLIPDDWNC
jgi:hypothetical protein